MPLPKRPAGVKPASTEEAETRLPLVRPRPNYPRRMSLFVVMLDMSGSMRNWWEKQGTFIPALRDAVIDAGGEKAAEIVFILYVALSGEVTFSGFAPLKDAKDPEFVPGGETPVGQALTAIADQVEGIIASELIPNEVTVRNVRVALVSDLHPTGETAEETEAGVTRFLEVMRKYRAEVQIVGPSSEAMNHDLARRLNVSEAEPVYLDSADPKAVFKWTFNSVLEQSRKATGSHPRLKKS